MSEWRFTVPLGLTLSLITVLAGCGGEAALDPAEPGTDLSSVVGLRIAQTYVGEVEGGNGLIGIVVDATEYVAFVANEDGDQRSTWFTGRVEDGRLIAGERVLAANEPVRLSGVIRDGIASGTLALEDGAQRSWFAEPADLDNGAGLYAYEDSDSLVGLIVTNDLRMAGSALDLGSHEVTGLQPSEPVSGQNAIEAEVLGELAMMIDLVRVDSPSLGQTDDASSPSGVVSPVDPAPTSPPGVIGIAARGDVIQIKFKDDLRIRLDGDATGKMTPKDLDGLALTGSAAIELLARVSEGQWARAHIAKEHELDRIRESAMQKSGESFPDLNLYFSLRLPDAMNNDEAIALFNTLEEVERAYAMPDYYLPEPPSYSSYRGTFPAGGQDFEYPYQKYLYAGPIGVDARYAWDIPGGRGQDVNVALIESGFNAAHGDLPPITVDGLVPTGLPADRINHGTATWGVIGGVPNGMGVTGIADATSKYFISVGLLGHQGALAWAIGLDGVVINTLVSGKMRPGDVIVLELQASGPNGPENYLPAEWEEPVFHAIRIATANGLVVVEAAGNGFQDLDSDDLAGDPAHPHEPFLVDADGQRVNDSGAIMVGAGSSGTTWGATFLLAARHRLPFSNYGGRVDVQAWGDGVVTTGLGKTSTGTIYDADGPNMTFRSDFGGTSSATAILGGVASALQGAHKFALHGEVLSSKQMRDVLVRTGTPQPTANADEHIGPLPNLRDAIDWFTATLPELAPLPFDELPVNVADFYCAGTLRMPAPRFSLESGMLSFSSMPIGGDFDFGGRTLPGPDLGGIDDLIPPLGGHTLELEFGNYFLIEGSQIYYTLDGTMPALCTGAPQCGSTQVWNWSDSAQGNAIPIAESDLPMTVVAVMTTTACGPNQPVSEPAVANYVPYSDIPAPMIFLGNRSGIHQESKVFTKQGLEFLSNAGVLEDGELCVRLDFNGAAGGPYIRFTTDGSDPIDTTEDGSITPAEASPIWTDASISAGECIPIFSVDDLSGTIVTVKAQNFVYLGSGPYVGGAMVVETYILDE